MSMSFVSKWFTKLKLSCNLKFHQDVQLVRLLILSSDEESNDYINQNSDALSSFKALFFWANFSGPTFIPCPTPENQGWRTLCFKEHFTQKEHFASQELNTLCFKEHFTKSRFTPQHTLLLNTLCYSEPFTPHYTLLLSTLCSSEHFAPQHTLLQRTLYSKGTLCFSRA